MGEQIPLHLKHSLYICVYPYSSVDYSFHHEQTDLPVIQKNLVIPTYCVTSVIQVIGLIAHPIVDQMGKVVAILS